MTDKIDFQKKQITDSRKVDATAREVTEMLTLCKVIVSMLMTAYIKNSHLTKFKKKTFVRTMKKEHKTT